MTLFDIDCNAKLIETHLPIRWFLLSKTLKDNTTVIDSNNRYINNISYQ